MSSNSTDPMGVLVLLLVVSPFLLIALYFFYIWVRDRRHARATRSWPVTTGRVMTSGIKSHQSYSSSSHTHTTVYDAQVVYEYMVNGARYQSSQISVGTGYSTSMVGEVQNKAAQYPMGAPVQVFYNPANPQEAVLEHGTAGGILYLFLALFIVGILGVVVICPMISYVLSQPETSKVINTVIGVLLRR
jgi:uncharacterized protein DUF3592